MKPTGLVNLHAFIQSFPYAWEALASVSPNTVFVDFQFIQDRGSFVATDDKGGTHAFRMYGDTPIALISPNGFFSFIEGQAIVLSKELLARI